MEFLEQLISAIEQDELEQPSRDALLRTIYTNLDSPGLDSFAGDVILNDINCYMLLSALAAARGAQLDFALWDYELRLEEAVRLADRTFGN